MNDYIHDFFGSIWEMLFDLHVLKFEDLKSIWECCLGSLCFCKIIDNFWIWKCLLNITVVEVYYSVSIRECLSAYSIAEYDFFFTGKVSTLYFTIIAYDLVLNSGLIRIGGTVILFWEFHLIIFIFIIRSVFISLTLILIIQSLQITSHILFMDFIFTIYFRNIFNIFFIYVIFIWLLLLSVVFFG